MSASASRMPRRLQDRADRDHRVRGPDHDRLRGRDRVERPRAWRRRRPRRGSRRRRPGPRLAPLIMNSWSGHHPSWASTRVRTGASLIGSTRARTPSAAASVAWASVSRRAAVQRLRARSHADREVAVAEVEPDSTPSSRRPSITWNVSPSQAPAAFVDQVRQPERDQVGVRRHVGAVDLDVVAGVGDHDQRRRGRRRRASRGRAWPRRCPPARTTTGPLTGR